MLVGDAIEERHDEVQARLEHAVELAEALHHPGVLLRHDAHALEDEDDDHSDEECSDRGRRAMRERRDTDRDEDSDRHFPEHETSLLFVIG